MGRVDTLDYAVRKQNLNLLSVFIKNVITICILEGVGIILLANVVSTFALSTTVCIDSRIFDNNYTTLCISFY